jgi:hypothetical protein
MGPLGDALKVSTYTDLLNGEVGVVLACRALIWVLAAVVLAALMQGGPVAGLAGRRCRRRPRSAAYDGHSGTQLRGQ